MKETAATRMTIIIFRLELGKLTYPLFSPVLILLILMKLESRNMDDDDDDDGNGCWNLKSSTDSPLTPDFIISRHLMNLNGIIIGPWCVSWLLIPSSHGIIDSASWHDMMIIFCRLTSLPPPDKDMPGSCLVGCSSENTQWTLRHVMSP